MANESLSPEAQEAFRLAVKEVDGINAVKVRRLQAAIDTALEHHKWGRYREMAECLERTRDAPTVGAEHG